MSSNSPFEEKENKISIKIALVGETQTGKTSLLIKYVENRFDSDHIQTVGMNFMEKEVDAGDVKLNLSIWDLGGQQENVHMLPLVCDGAMAIIFVFDLMRKSTLTAIKEWFKKARQLNKAAVPILVATKFDLFSQQDAETVESITKQARKFAKAMKAPLVFTSSSHSININKLFTVIISRIFDSPCSLEEISNVGEPILEFK